MPSATARVDDPGRSGAFEAAIDVTGPSLLEVTGSLTPPRITSPRWPLAAGRAGRRDRRAALRPRPATGAPLRGRGPATGAHTFPG
jgi:hypothetical protein